MHKVHEGLALLISNMQEEWVHACMHAEACTARYTHTNETFTASHLRMSAGCFSLAAVTSLAFNLHPAPLSLKSNIWLGPYLRMSAGCFCLRLSARPATSPQQWLPTPKRDTLQATIG